MIGFSAMDALFGDWLAVLLFGNFPYVGCHRLSSGDRRRQARLYSYNGFVFTFVWCYGLVLPRLG